MSLKKMKCIYKKSFSLKYIDIHQGFTLIELLVVTIIVGVLAAVATPTLLGNIGKSRETEATSNLGIISRSQEGYHFENQKFADTMLKLTSNVTLTSSYYNFPDPSSNPIYDATKINILVQHQAVPINVSQDVVKNYASGVYFEPTSSNFNMVICKANSLNQIVDAPGTSAGSCSNSGRKIK
jgi:type IV pilus assembly protein PilA